jgi:ADP-ribose pyrophosphatase
MRDSGPMSSSWELLCQRPGPIGYITVVTNTYRLPDGSVADWDILAAHDSVAVLAFTSNDEVVLARQYRPGPNAVLDELPGGMIDAGETPIDAARRELLEETGYRGGVSIVGYTFVAANSTRKSWITVATGCVQVAQPATEPTEFCEPLLVSLSEFRTLLQSGQMTDVGIAYMALDALDLL